MPPYTWHVPQGQVYINQAIQFQMIMHNTVETMRRKKCLCEVGSSDSWGISIRNMSMACDSSQGHQTGWNIAYFTFTLLFQVTNLKKKINIKYVKICNAYYYQYGIIRFLYICIVKNAPQWCLVCKLQNHCAVVTVLESWNVEKGAHMYITWHWNTKSSFKHQEQLARPVSSQIVPAKHPTLNTSFSKSQTYGNSPQRTTWIRTPQLSVYCETAINVQGRHTFIYSQILRFS